MEIITVGDELLLGQTTDTNSAWMGLELARNGFAVRHKAAISDDPKDLCDALDAALGRCSIVLVTGGLGPTLDDRTKPTLAEYFGVPLKLHEPTLEAVRAYFDRRGLPFLEVNRLQAELPAGAGTAILPNPLGTAQGMWFEREGAVVVSMPGVPHEMKGLMSNEVIPRLMERFDRPFRYHRTLLCFGWGESYLSQLLGEWETGLAGRGVELAYLPSFGQVRVRLSAVGFDESAVRALVDGCIEEAAVLLAPHVASTQHEHAPEGLAAALSEAGLQLAVAESFTGGAIAAALTAVPGASTWFRGGVVAYTEAVKASQLGVPTEVLAEHTAVSAPVAEAMARGVRERLGADWSVATTGYAGPGSEPEVGTAFISVAGPSGSTTTKEFHWGRSREVNIQRGVTEALHLIWSQLRKGNEDCQKKVV